MGGCIGVSRGRGRSRSRSRSRSRNRSGAVAGEQPAGATSGGARKNHPLCHETIRWKSDVPLTEGQLRSKRDEFWDTAPAFDGRKEIWDALRAAAVAAESLDFELAQAILDGAGVSVPNGYLTECYDELGARYQLPIYCLSYPINIVKEDGGTGTSTGGRDSPADCSEPVDAGIETLLKLRLSHTCVDVKLPVYSSDTVGICKKKLQSQEGVEASKQRWFFGGKLLGDKLRVDEAKVQSGYIVQVIVNTELATPPVLHRGS